MLGRWPRPWRRPAVRWPDRHRGVLAAEAGATHRPDRRWSARRDAVRGPAPSVGRGHRRRRLGRPRVPGPCRWPRRPTIGRFVEAAAAAVPGALANNRFSADIVAIARAARRAGRPARPGRPTTLCRAGWPRSRRPGRRPARGAGGWASTSTARSTSCCSAGAWARWPAGHRPGRGRRPRSPAIRAVAADRRGGAGRRRPDVARRPCAGSNDRTASRTRALVEERGLRTSTPWPAPTGIGPRGCCWSATGRRRSGRHLARLGDAAVVDSRVLLAHRLGADERAGRSPEDRFASDLLLPERIADPWLRELTARRGERADPDRARRPHAGRARACGSPSGRRG